MLLQRVVFLDMARQVALPTRSERAKGANEGFFSSVFANVAHKDTVPWGGVIAGRTQMDLLCPASLTGLKKQRGRKKQREIVKFRKAEYMKN